MDNDNNNLHRNEYDGNGWSKYQKLVMAQLEGHTKLLETMMSEINTIKQQNALQELLTKTWREDITTKVTEIKNDVDYMWSDDRGFDSRIKALEDNIKIDTASTLKFKGSWAVIGGVAVIVIELVMKSLEFFIHKP